MAQEVYKQYSEFISSQKTNPDIGITFNNGWSPELELVEESGNVYLKFKQWVGGEGISPSAPADTWDYITPTGFGQVGTAINLRVTAGAGGIYIDEAITPYTAATITKVPYVVYDTATQHIWIWDGTLWYDAGLIDSSGKADKVSGGVIDRIILDDGTGNIKDSTYTIATLIAATASGIGVFTDIVDGLVPAPTTLTGEYYLRHDGTWQVPTGGSGATTLDALSDVSITSLTLNDLLIYGGAGYWNNTTPSNVYMKAVTNRYYRNTTYSADTTLAIPATYPYDVIDVLIGNATPKTLIITLANPSVVASGNLWIKGDCTYGGCIIIIKNASGTTIATYTGRTGLHLFGYNGTAWYLLGEVVLSDRIASSTTTGLVQLATNGDIATGNNITKAVTPAGLVSRVGTTTQTGLTQLSTDLQTLGGVSTTTVITPSNLAAKIPLIQEVIDIGVWDMHTGASISVPHGLTTNYKKIRSITVIIRDDADTVYDVFPTKSDDAYSSITSTTITLTPGTWWADGQHTATVLNRGWITIWRTF